MLPGETYLDQCRLSNQPVDNTRFKVLSSSAGWYIGTIDEEGYPNTRETGYYKDSKEAWDIFWEWTHGNYVSKR